MQSDEQWVLPDSRDGEPRNPQGERHRAPEEGPGAPEEGPSAPDEGNTLDEGQETRAELPPGRPPAGSPTEGPPAALPPPQMPAPPQMPGGGPPPSGWGTQASAPAPPPNVAAAPPPVSPAPRSSVPKRVDAPATEPATMAAIDAPEPDVPSEDPAPPVHPSASSARSGVAPVQGDWLASVCPYLASEDGTYRSAAPVEGHRCTAQDPPTTLPLAFQERFCLTERHPRCEMYKFAQQVDASGAIPASQVPPTDPPTPRVRRVAGDGSRRPLLAAGGGIVIVVLVVVLVLIMDSCSGDGGSTVGPDDTTDPQTSEAPVSTPTPRPTPTPEPVPTVEPDPDAAPAQSQEVSTAEIRILYEIQPDEALRQISETFGVSRNRIRRENPGLADLAPAEMPGTVIELPIVGDMTLEEAQALEGYLDTAP